jgi:OmcA/MtrC family decaheme c-type cytochrome
MRISTSAIAAVPCALCLLLGMGPKFMLGRLVRTWPQAQQINPGLAFEVVSSDVAKDGTISVRYRVMDATGLPLDVTGKQTSGTISVSHQAGYVPTGQSYFQSYSTRPPPAGRNPVTLGAEDSGGTLEAVGAGEYIYTFRTKAPPGWDSAATHRIAVHGLRDLKQWGLGIKYADTTFDFVPAGGTPKPPELYRHCNNCHGATQAAPDGSPRSEQLCILCHHATEMRELILSEGRITGGLVNP